MSAQTGLDLSKVFQQYLTTTMVPELQYKLNGSSLAYRWANVVPGFAMPVRVTVGDSAYALIRPTTSWQTMRVHLASAAAFGVDPDFYVESRDMNTAAAGATSTAH
jgi:hypothetical protein